MVLSRTFTGGRTHMLLNRHILIEMSEWASEPQTISLYAGFSLSPLNDLDTEP